jgi:hypothetical protein
VQLLLPRSDAAVVAQAVVLALVVGAALVCVWDRAELRLLVTGLGVMAGAWMALRAVH